MTGCAGVSLARCCTDMFYMSGTRKAGGVIMAGGTFARLSDDSAFAKCPLGSLGYISSDGRLGITVAIGGTGAGSSVIVR